MSRIVNNPTRKPVNKQAALIMRRAVGLCVLPETDLSHARRQLIQLEAHLQNERKRNAVISEELGRTREKLRILKAQLELIMSQQ